MQDCIDRIIPLIFSEISDNAIEYNEGPLFLMFGERIENIKNILESINIKLFEIQED